MGIPNYWSTMKEIVDQGGISGASYGIANKDALTLYVDPELSAGVGLGTFDSPHGGPTGLQTAIDRCEDDRGDLIIVNEGNHNVTTSVLFNKRGITVQAARLGLSPGGIGEKFMVNAASSFTSGPTGTILSPCIIRGLGFAGRNISTGESLLFDGQSAGGFNAGFSLIDNCRFPVWYGAINAGIRFKGGSTNMILNCLFDGLFGGFGAAAIECEVSGSIDPAYLRIIGCEFHGVGSGIYAIKHEDKVLSYFYAYNKMLPGFLGNTGKFLDNDSTSSTGTAANNFFGGFANKSAVADNLDAACEFVGNQYDE